MYARRSALGSRCLVGLCLTAGCLSQVGCLMLPIAGAAGFLQTNIGGQTLPSAYYLEDDVQYFPTGPETKLSNQIRALDRYKVERDAMRAGADGAGY